MIVNAELARRKGVDKKDLWQTPDHIFGKLNDQFGFTLDPCCEPHTALCSTYFTPEENGLAQSWYGHRAFVNPPYSRGNIDRWVEKCYIESYYSVVVGLLPVSTSADWWHKWVIGKAGLWFVDKRIRFKGALYTAPFSSVIIVWGESEVKSFKQ